MRATSSIVGLLLLAAQVAQAQTPAAQPAPAAPVKAAPVASYKVTQGASHLDYTVVHTLHTVVGVSKKPEGKVVVLPDGTVQVMVRAPVASFDSENANRDEHMQETMEAAKYPMIVFKGLTRLQLPTSYPATVKTNVDGELDFHGRKRRESIPVEITFASATEAHVSSKFNVSLDAYEVERPSLMLVKIEDACRVALDLALARENQ